MNKQFTKIKTDEAICPGMHLKEVLEYKSLTQKELARRLGRPEKTISGIATGKIAITPHTALELENVLDISAKFWLNLETDYQLTKAHIKELKALEKDVPRMKKFPIKELIERGLIEPYVDKVFELRELLRYLKIPSIDLLQPNYQAIYRQSTAGKNPEVVAVWLREGQILSESMDLPVFDKNTVEELIQDIRSMTIQQPKQFENRLKESLASAGLGLILIEEYPKGGVNGAYYRFNDHPFIQINLRGKYADIFWFTLFHELGHALIHTYDKIIVDYDSDTGLKEDEANEFASNILIPPSEYKEIERKKRYSEEFVKDFAYNIGIHPGIVVGRLQHDKYLSHGCLNGLRDKLMWISEA